MVTIMTALVVTSHSGTTAAASPTAATTPPQLVAANTPAHRPAPIADVPAAPAADSTGDGGGAPVVGSGPCKVAVSTTPAGSIVSVDGEPAGPSPITIGGPCAKRKLDIAHPRYQSVTRWITPVADSTNELDVALARPTHELFVESSPSGATVSIDGHRAGTTPTMVKIMGFTTLSLTIEKFGFKAQTKKVYSKVPHDRVTTKLGH